MKRLDGKVVLVTGGGGLLGAAFSRALAEDGAQVLVNDIDGERAESTVKEILAMGGDASATQASVASWDEAERVVDTCLERFGRIDCLVNSAHAFATGTIAELTEESLRLTLDSHVTGHFACTHHAVRHMIKQGSGGSVINLVSRAMQGLREFSAYGAAKGAILSATFSWALELAEHGIRVNAVSPAARRREPGEAISLRMPWRRESGQSATDMSQLTPTPESVAPLIVYLASDASSWVSGQALFLAGDSLALIRHPMEHHLVLKPEGWTVKDLERDFRPSLGPALEHPSMQAAPYRWHGGIRK